jgi:aspartyl-tRNA(Asn)/glutamyl-tRNA(Gln) amidotransferase subunit C
MISREEVQHIAKLARLELSEQEIEKMQEELSSVLDYIEKLKEVDISGIESKVRATDLENVMRKDKADNVDPAISEKLLDEAPSKKGNHIKVKSVF